jgi:hypothetical protein
VAGKTVSGTADILAGIPAGVAKLAVGGVTHPVRTGEEFVKGFGADLSRRYGPLVAGNDRAFVARIKREGAAPELADIAGAAGGEGAIAGRALTGAAKAGTLGERAARIATEARPLLRVSGDEARAQATSPNFFRAVAQHAEDKARQTVLARRNARHGEVAKGLQPRSPEGPRMGPHTPPRAAGEVVPVFQGRAQRIAVSKLSARSFSRNRHEQTLEINKGTERDLAGLSAKQRKAVMSVASGYIPLERKAGESEAAYIGRVRMAIRGRRQQIHDYRAANDVPSDPEILKPHRELGALDYLDKHAEEIFGGDRLARFHAATLARSKRLAAADPGLHPLTAEAHPLIVQGEALGIPFEPTLKTATKGGRVVDKPMEGADLERYTRG